MNISFLNLDLLSVGITVSATAIIGFMVFFSNWRSITSRAFLLFSLITATWSIFNYLYYQFNTADVSFHLIRFVIFLGTLHSFSFFQLCYVFPEGRKKFPKWYFLGLLPVIAVTAILTLTPLVFYKVGTISETGAIEKINNGPGIGVFAAVVLGMVMSGIILLIKKTRHAQGLAKRQLSLVLLGVFLTFILLMVFNFILPAFFNDPRYIPLGAVFIFPFVAFTAYAIFRHHLLNVKVVATEIMAFFLAVATLFEVFISANIIELLLRVGVFVLVLIFGILLIKSVLKEVEQREELQVLTEKLQKANIELERLSRFKTQLLSLASHQIKSPLAVIKGFVSLLMDGTYGRLAAKQTEALGKVKNEADDLVKLVNDLLDLRKVEEGRMEYKFEPTDVVKMSKDIVEELKQLAIQKKLELTFQSREATVMVNADPKLHQVILNLVDNAIKYTPSGFVKLEIVTEGNKVLVSVKDSGFGMDSELLTHVFEEFVRGEGVKRTIRGTGLGLYIAKSIVEAHGGRIWAESPGEGGGSSFFVELKKI